MFVFFYDWPFPHMYFAKNAAYFPFNSSLSFQRLCRLLWECCLCTEKRLSYVYRPTLIHGMYSKHMLPVVVLSLTPLNDLLMTSPETRSRSRAPDSLAIRFAFTRDSPAADAAIAADSLAVRPATSGKHLYQTEKR